MTQICELVTSIRGHPRLVVDGYLMSKDKNAESKKSFQNFDEFTCRTNVPVGQLYLSGK